MSSMISQSLVVGHLRYRPKTIGDLNQGLDDGLKQAKDKHRFIIRTRKP